MIDGIKKNDKARSSLIEMKKIISVLLIMIVAVSIVGCGKNNVENKSSGEEIQTVTAADESNVEAVTVAETPDSQTEPVKVEDGEEEKRESNGSVDDPVEVTNAKKLWRTYELKDNESTIPRFLYLEVFLDSSNVEIYHEYYAENTYSLIPWPISDGVIEVKEFSADGGAPNTWEMYIEYSEQVIKLYEIDDNDGSLLDSYYEFVFSQEDVLE
jgi:hypothetical protein